MWTLTPTAIELFTKLRTPAAAWAVSRPPGRSFSTATITALTKPIDWLTGDTLLDADDLDLLTSGLTVADAPDDPRIRERRSLFAWIEAQGRDLGRSRRVVGGRYYSN